MFPFAPLARSIQALVGDGNQMKILAMLRRHFDWFNTDYDILPRFLPPDHGSAPFPPGSKDCADLM